MKLSAQEEYGLRCLVTLAQEGEDGFLTIPEISRREGLTPSHVAKLLSILRRSGFVNSTRGQLGGYSLGMPTNEMLVRDVLECLGGRLFDEDFCERHTGIVNNCTQSSDCLVRPLWTTIQNAVDQALARLTVADLISGAMPNCNVSSLDRPPAVKIELHKT